MHSYQHNIKTFNNATRHLTRVERSLYRDLIELYYDTENALTADIKKLQRLVIAQNDEEKEALNYVLDEFFELTGDVYTHSFCDEVIEAWNDRGWLPSDPNIEYLRPPAEEWKKIRTRVIKRDGYTCQYCGSVGGRLECDHIVPVSRGGSSEDENLCCACHKCNRSKSNRLVSEWRKA